MRPPALRGLVALCAAAALACAPTYDDMLSSGDAVICPGEGLCPGTDVCLQIESESRCVRSLTCSLLKQDCAALHGSNASYANRTRCTLVQTGDGAAGPQCTQKYGQGAEGAGGCDILTPTSADFGIYVGTGLFTHFPADDRSCASGLICHTLTMEPTQVGGRPGVAGSATCRRFCKADADCASGRCIDAFGKAVTQASVQQTDGAAVGVCYPTCTLLPAAGKPTGCEAQPGTLCQPVMAAGSLTIAFGICRKPGASQPPDEGRLCSEAAACPAGYGCLATGGGFSCHKLCGGGAAAKCATGQACSTSTYALADGAGVCQ